MSIKPNLTLICERGVEPTSRPRRRPKMITKELVERALETSHDACATDAGCIHAEGVSQAEDAIHKSLLELLTSCFTNPLAAPLHIFYAGLHVGYRLRDLETTPLTPKEIN
jgi:hypothetical protein